MAIYKLNFLQNFDYAIIHQNIDVEIEYFLETVQNFDFFCQDDKSFVSFEYNQCFKEISLNDVTTSFDFTISTCAPVYSGINRQTSLNTTVEAVVKNYMYLILATGSRKAASVLFYIENSTALYFQEKL